MTRILSLPWAFFASYLSFLLRAVGVSALLDDTPFNRATFIMTHNSATGEDPSFFTACNNQGSTTMVQQLNCGARAFDYRPRLESGDVVRAHHGIWCPVSTPMATSVQRVIDWLASNPTELVVLYVSHFEGYCGEECLKDAAEAVLNDKGVYTVRGSNNYECPGLQGLTVGDVKSLSALPTGGYLFAVFGSAGGGNACMDEQFGGTVECTSSTSCDFASFDNYMSGATNFPDSTHASTGELYMTQACWQGAGNHVSIETGTDLNNYIAAQTANGAYNFANFIEVNNVCNNGLVMKAAIDEFFNSPAPVSNCLRANEQLIVGEYMQSNNGLYRARLDEDGKLCIYDIDDGFTNPIWCTGSETGMTYPDGSSAPGGPGILKMQEDGNLVLYTTTEVPYWDANSFGSDAYLVLQNDRNLVIYSGSSIWECSVNGNRGSACVYVTQNCVDCNNNVCTGQVVTSSPTRSPTSSPSKAPTKSPTSDCNDNGTCDPGEDCVNCASDCAKKTSGRIQYCCDGSVEPDCGSSNCVCSIPPPPSSCVCSELTDPTLCNACGQCRWQKRKGQCTYREFI